MNDAKLTIGEVAQLAGIKTSAIRYYESIGVLPEPERHSGQRRYTLDTVRRLQVIDVAKRAGFSLDDARVLLSTENDGRPAYEQLRGLAQRKLPEIDVLIERAQAMRDWLNIATGCACRTLDACALFDAVPAAEQEDALTPSAAESSLNPAPTVPSSAPRP